MIDLLPCPFCGGEARLTVHEGYHRASCFTCGNGTRAYADRHEAVRRWSRRFESGHFHFRKYHGTTEEASGVGSVSDLEIVREDAAMSELKPCPFCGSVDLDYGICHGTLSGFGYVQCKDCGAEIKEATKCKKR